MKSTISRLAPVMVLRTTVLAAVLPEMVDTTVARLERSAPPLQMQQAMGNLSFSFGWTMAAAALSTYALDATCDNITTTGHGKWFAEGLMPQYIVEPICNASHSGPNTTIALPYQYYYNTEVFITQLTNAFAPNNTNASLSYLCDNLRFLLLDGFHMRDARILNATCAGAGLQQPPRPAQPLVAINTNLTDSYVNTASVLYAMLFASSARSDADLDVYCAHAPDHVGSLDAMMLNGTLVCETICDIPAPMSVEESTAAIQIWSSWTFVTVVENASNVDGYLTWLCDNLDPDAMDAVGLAGGLVHARVCSDAQGTS